MGEAPQSDIRLTQQLSSGPDGSRYAARDGRGEEVVVERLFLARKKPERWRELTAQLELARQISHEHVIPPHTYALSARDPYVVRRLPPPTLASQLGDGPHPAPKVTHYLHQLADALAAGHRLGLAHGAIGPSQIYAADHGLVIDFARTHTGAPDPHPIDGACRAPAAYGNLPDDVFALGALALSLLLGHPTQDPSHAHAITDPKALGLMPLLTDMLAVDAVGRPAMFEVLARLRHANTVRSEGGTLEMTVDEPPASEELTQLGRYQLEKILGQGSMGRVYRGIDPSTGEAVAIKVLLPQWSQNSTTLKRFYREAQVMADLDNPFIARFFEVNQDQGMHFLAMEFVEGRSMMDWLLDEGIPPADVALEMTRDVARALAEVHELGVIHRDVKPANILLQEREGGLPQVKLCDFGIALTNEPGEEKVTRAGVTVGTPQYMAPEQCVGAELDPAADVYALGITLFRMLAGRVPFDAKDPAAVVYQHLSEPIPDIRGFNPDLDAEVIGLLDRMLVKDPTERIAHAGAVLEALERVQRGAPKSMDHHPRRPEGKSMSYPFQWQLRGQPADLWPYVSDTERLNRAIGLGAVDYDRQVIDGLVRTTGRMRLNGVAIEWTEHAYEWVAPHRLGILREFTAGPFVWFRSTVELEAQGGGTLLTHTVEVEPRGVIGRAAAAMEVGFKAKKNLERVYRRIDRFVTQQPATQRSEQTSVAIPTTLPSAAVVADAFEEAPDLSPEQRARIDEAEERLLDDGLEPELARQLCRHVRRAAPQDVARIRPRVLARHASLDHRAVLRACLLATRAGLLDMLWDVICPRCRIPADIATSLAALKDAHHCEACALDFGLDFSESVEIIFRPTAIVRDSELGTFCIGGPGHTPHVVAQVQLAPRERFAIDLTLDEGSYLVMGRQMPNAWEFRVERGAHRTGFEVPLADGIPAGTSRALSADGQRIVICNDTDHEVVARIERASTRRDAVTAAEAASSATFRQLFPHEALAPGRMLAVQRLTILTVTLSDPWAAARDESEVLAQLGALHRAAETHCEQEGGAVVKIHRDGVLATFTEPGAALRVAEHLVQSVSSPIAIAGETGSALATSINDRLDYFGRVLHDVDRLLDAARPGHLVMGETLATDPASLQWLDGRVGELVQASHGVVGHQVALAR